MNAWKDDRVKHLSYIKQLKEKEDAQNKIKQRLSSRAVSEYATLKRLQHKYTYVKLANLWNIIFLCTCYLLYMRFPHPYTIVLICIIFITRFIIMLMYWYWMRHRSMYDWMKFDFPYDPEESGDVFKSNDED